MEIQVYICVCLCVRGCLLCVYVYKRTFISPTVPVSVYTTVNEPIQQHTAVRYYSWLR